MPCRAHSCDLPTRALPDDPEGMHPDCLAYAEDTGAVVPLAPLDALAAAACTRTPYASWRDAVRAGTRRRSPSRAAWCEPCRRWHLTRP